MRHISLKSVFARLSVTLLLLMGSMSASAQYYLNVYEKTGSNNQYEISNLDSVSISDVKEYTPVLTQLSISQNQVSLETGESTTLTVKGYDADGAEMSLEDLKWKSSDYSVASVDENGVVRTYQSGNAVITALVGDVSASCSVVVTDHIYTVADVVKIALDKDSLKLETGQSASISAIGLSLNGIEISLDIVDWKSSNTSVASVDGRGLIKTYTSGVVEIIASFGTISDTCIITVADHIYTLDEVVEIIIDRDTLNFETGESGKLSVRGFAADGTEIQLSNIVWESSDYSLASVDVNGNVRTYKSGSADIVALLGNVTDTCAVIIKDHVYTLDEVVKLSLNKVALNVETGDGDSLSVRGFAADGVEIQLSNIQWKSNNNSIVTVNNSGVVETLNSGNALIIATLNNISDTCVVTVVDHVYTQADVVKIEIDRDTLYLEIPQANRDTLKVKGYAANGVEIAIENIVWKSSAQFISIGNSGAVRAWFSGNAFITASFGYMSDTCIVNAVDHIYTLDEVDYLLIDKDNLNLETGDVDTLIVKGYSTNWYEIPLDDNIIWETNNPSVVTVDNNGVIKAKMKGNATITASLGEKIVSCSVTVKDKFVDINVTIDSLAKSGVYMGVMSFNKQLYTKPISILNTDSKNAFDSFIDGMEMKNGTLLCYSVDNAIDSLGSVVLPDNVSKVAIVTFTDGLDQGSIDMIEAMTGQYYDSDDEYLAAIKHKIKTYSLAGVPITAYSVGVRGSDVKDLLKFQSTLKQLASTDEYAIEVQNMSEVNAKFKEIASQLNRSVNYQTVPIIMPGLSNGTRVRFTFDNVADATKSTLYVEGTYNRRDRTLTDVEYHGMTSSSGTVVAGEITEVIFTKFTLENILTDDNSFINKNFINEWYMTSDGTWQINSEFDPDQQPDIEMESSSILIMLVLDCSSSLGDDFGTAKANAKDFISTMYSATGGNESNNGSGSNSGNTDDSFSLYSKTPIDLSLAVSIDGARYYLTKEQFQKANLNKAIIEGLTVVFGGESFIIATRNEDIGNVSQNMALRYYGTFLPTINQGKVISTRWSYIDNALNDFGGTSFSSYFWTGENYYNSSESRTYYYYVGSGGGQIYSTIWSDTYLPVRLICPTETPTPVVWRDPYDLTLVAYKNGERFNFSQEEWNNEINKGDYEKAGVMVSLGSNRFIISLQDEQIENIYQSNAITYYGPYLPSYDQAQLISLRWNNINNAIVAFGGTGLSSYYWTNLQEYSSSKMNYFYFGNGAGTVNSTIYNDNQFPVRLIYPNDKYKKYEYVDLGLSVKWATTNVGAYNPEDNGIYYGWGEDETKTTYFYGWQSYKYSGGAYNNLTKYCYNSSCGSNNYTDSKTILDIEDDIANIKLEGNWRMPTKEEFEELLNENNCEWVWTRQNGVNGYKVISKKPGYEGNSIFLPAAGYKPNGNMEYFSRGLYYWSSSLDTSNNPHNAYILKANTVESVLTINAFDRYYGCTVRPVFP